MLKVKSNEKNPDPNTTGDFIGDGGDEMFVSLKEGRCDS